MSHQDNFPIRLTRRVHLKTLSALIAAGAFPMLNITQAVAADASKKTAAVEPATVYFTKTISGPAVLALFERGGQQVITGKTLIKVHVGEPGNPNYLSPDLVRDLCLRVKGTLGDSNVYYPSARGSTEGHRKVAHDHGFTFAPFDVLDADGAVDLPIKGGKHVKEAKMGSHVMNYDSLIILTHFKGHGMAGFGGAIKNMAMGIASKEGKGIIHGSGFRYRGEEFLERLAEYGKGMADAKPGHIFYINVMNKMSTDCDCDGHPAPVAMADIGIAASTDIVALEQACFDMVKKAAGPEGNALTHRIRDKEGEHQIRYAEQLGMGTSKYKLVEVGQ